MFSRRTYLRTAGTLATLSALAGCTDDGGDGSGDGGGGDDGGSDGGDGGDDGGEPSATPTEGTPERSITDVAVGPEKRLRFEPEDIEISLGDTVRWEAMSEGHNVTSHPDASPKCENPDGADPFTSYEGDEHFSIMDVGETFEHEFTVAGEYVYVCTPHAGQGMVGSVVVTE